MKVSLVTSTYQCEDYLKRYAKHVAKFIKEFTASGHEIEIIIIANDPSDNELKIIEKIAESPHLIYQKVPRESVYASWNRGMNLATGEILGWWNVDDIRYAKGVLACAQALCKGADMVYSTFIYKRYIRILGLKILAKLMRGKMVEFNRNESLRSMLCGPFIMFTKEYFKKIGPFDEQFIIAGDFEWCVRAAKVGGNIKLVDVVSGVFHNDGTSLSGSKNKIHPVENNVVYIKHGAWDKILPVDKSLYGRYSLRDYFDRPMKIVVLIFQKNDKWILPTFLSSVRSLADEIIAIDNGSTDGAVDYLQSQGVKVVANDRKIVLEMSEKEIRDQLLKLGREIGGTHFICLDADEAFTSPFIKNGRQLISEMLPGEKLQMRWVPMWGSSRKYRKEENDFRSVYKDFIFCDDKVSVYQEGSFNTGRTPGSRFDLAIKIEEKEGAVLHFQNAPLKRSQIKQTWYRCLMFLKNIKSARRINATFSGSLEDGYDNPADVPMDWLEGLVLPTDEELAATADCWFKDEVLSYFDKYGIGHFEDLQIWHINEYRERFIREIGREPQPKIFPHWVLILNNIKNRLRSKMQ